MENGLGLSRLESILDSWLACFAPQEGFETKANFVNGIVIKKSKETLFYLLKKPSSTKNSSNLISL